MFYDLNLNSTFKDFEELESVDHNGFCIVQESVENLKEIEPISIQNKASKPIYTRINIEYNKKLDAGTLNNLMKFNLICITGVDNTNISSVMKLEPDLITLKTEDVKHIKRSFINALKQKKIHVELCICDLLYNAKERIVWLNVFRRLLKFGCADLLVLSSGAKVFTELKSSNEICKLLNVFGLSDDKIKKILSNSEKVMQAAALKRYSVQNALSSNVEEDAFKRDFIIKYYQVD